MTDIICPSEHRLRRTERTVNKQGKSCKEKRTNVPNSKAGVDNAPKTERVDVRKLDLSWQRHLWW